MTGFAILDLLSNDYELFGLAKDGEYNLEIGEAFQILTDDLINGCGKLVNNFLCGEVK